MKTGRIPGKIALLAVLLLLLTACAPKTGRVTNEQLLALRETYPLHNTVSVIGDSDYSRFQTWKEIEAFRYHAALELELTGDWTEKAIASGPFEDEAVNEAIGMTQVVGILHRAKVRRVLWGGEELQKGDEITLIFGSTIVMNTPFLEEVFRPGQRYVCLVNDSRGSDFGVDDLYAVGFNGTYYVSDDGAVVSVTDNIRCLASCSGMYMDTFAETLQTSLPARPDVEGPETE